MIGESKSRLSDNLRIFFQTNLIFTLRTLAWLLSLEANSTEITSYFSIIFQDYLSYTCGSYLHLLFHQNIFQDDPVEVIEDINTTTEY